MEKLSLCREFHCYNCNNDETLIVKSREGGFVTQNCTQCEKPYSISLEELPDLFCGECDEKLEVFISSLTRNYTYRCHECNTSVELASIVPNWQDLFDYRGFGLDSDYQE